MLTYHNDHTIKFSHTPVINKIGFQVNQVGPDDPYVFPDIDYTDTDANTIYLNGATGNDGNAGTAAAPKLTLLAAINATTATKTKVLAMNSQIFNEDISGGTFTYFQGVYNHTAQTSSWVGRLLGYTPADANSIFVAKTGDDGDAGTQAAPKLTIAGAIAACDASHQKVVIMDSETYSEEGFEFTGNFTGLYAAIGFAPIVEFTYNIDYRAFAEKIAEAKAFVTDSWNLNCCEIGNGKLLFVYASVGDSDSYYCVVDPLTNTVLKSPTVFQSQTAAQYQSCAKLTTGNSIVIFTTQTPSLQFIIISGVDYSILRSAETIETSATGFSGIAVCEYSGGYVFITYRNNAGTPRKYIVYETTGWTVYKAAANLYDKGTSTTNWASCTEISSGIIFLSYTYKLAAVEHTYIRSINTATWADVVAETELVADELWSHSSSKMYDDYILFIYSTNTNVDGYYLILKKSDLSTYVGGTIWRSANVNFACGCQLTSLGFEGYSILACTDAGDSDIYYRVWDTTYYHCKVSISSTFNGISIKASDKALLNKLFNNAAALYLKWCKIHDAKSATANTNCIVISSDSHVEITNSKIHDCDIGVDTTENTSNFADSQFYRINKGYAIDVDGAAASSGDITVEHCDIFDCYGGIHLENNHGTNEILKNNIIHDVDNYAIDAETAITFTNTVYTDAITGATVGASVVKANPLYLNEGYTNPADTDLNIKTKVLGYPADSPAKSLADDSRNAGSIDIEYIGTETAWTTITVAKPFSLNVEKEYAGEVNTQRRDGSYSSYKDGQSEIVEMVWKGITNAQYALLEALWLAESSTVRIYPDPTTYPSSYEVYTLLRKPMNDKVNYWQLSRTGRQDVKLTFARSYEGS